MKKNFLLFEQKLNQARKRRREALSGGTNKAKRLLLYLAKEGIK